MSEDMVEDRQPFAPWILCGSREGPNRAFCARFPVYGETLQPVPFSYVNATWREVLTFGKQRNQ